MEHSVDYGIDFQTAKCSCGKWKAEYYVENGNAVRWLRLQWEIHQRRIQCQKN